VRNGFSIQIGRVRHERVPIAHHVKTAFGVMTERHAVLLVLEDAAGAAGVGESWVNFPLSAPWERVAAFEHGFIPYLEGRAVEAVPAFMEQMYRAFVGPARQSGTIGPLLQGLCAVELALWDLAAQAAGVPLASHLFEAPASRVRVYASGLNSPIPWDLVDAHIERGVTLFKLKLGFGESEDRQNLAALKAHLGAKASIAVDVNRGWTLDEALAWLPALHEYDVQWIEEPLTAAEEVHLARLRERSGIPLAGGENVLMPPDAEPAELANTPFDILQPDLTKYAPLHVAKRLLPLAQKNGKRLVPHFLGSGPGQAASIQFAAGCPDALLELDINRNTLRTDLMTPPFEIVDGCIAIPELPGIGWRLRDG